MKILILRFSSIGDIILTSPVVRNLKKQMPDAEIHYCTKEAFKELVIHNPYIDKVHTLNKSMGWLIRQLHKEKYDLIIDLHKNLRTLRIKFSLFGIKSYSFDKLNFKKYLLTNFKINKLPDVHIVDRYMETVSKLGIENDGKGLDYFFPENHTINFQKFGLGKRKYAAIVIGAKFGTKQLPQLRIIEICKLQKIPVVLLGGPDEKETGKEIEKVLHEQIDITNLCGKVDLHTSAKVIERAEYVISHDTGLMHIAAAFHKKIYSVWGNTTPDFGMYPYKTQEIRIENNDISCRPCSKIGYDSCPKGHFKCMMDLNFKKYFA